MSTKSYYVSPAVSNFYGTEIEIWAGFGPVGNSGKRWVDYGHFLMGKRKNKL